MATTLTLEQRQMVLQAVERLSRRFEGQLNAETIERFVLDSADQILTNAKITSWIPLLAERFAADRLRALLRLESDVALNPASPLPLCSQCGPFADGGRVHAPPL